MEPIEQEESVIPDNFIDVTDQVDLEAYLEKNEDGKIDNVILRVFKNGIYEGLSLDIGPILSPKILKFFDENGKFKC